MNDLISRRKAFEYFVTLWECIGTIMDRDEWEDVCMTTANEIPSAQPERKTGKWIHQAKFGRIECDQCSSVYRNAFAPKNFCPNCGADMRGEQDGQQKSDIS